MPCLGCASRARPAARAAPACLPGTAAPTCWLPPSSAGAPRRAGRGAGHPCSMGSDCVARVHSRAPPALPAFSQSPPLPAFNLALVPCVCAGSPSSSTTASSLWSSATPRCPPRPPRWRWLAAPRCTRGWPPGAPGGRQSRRGPLDLPHAAYRAAVRGPCQPLATTATYLARIAQHACRDYVAVDVASGAVTRLFSTRGPRPCILPISPAGALPGQVPAAARRRNACAIGGR